MEYLMRFKSFVLQCKRVWHILKKPSAEEFKTVSKVSALGLLTLGLIGFVIADIVKFISGIFS
ncbi:MAG: protein translocase SEC61 complex subunit gamma [Nanoarchaeota archaeon]